MDEIAESFKKQKEIISSRKKNLVKLQMTQKLREDPRDTAGSEDLFLVFFFSFFLSFFYFLFLFYFFYFILFYFILFYLFLCFFYFFIYLFICLFSFS